MLIPTDSATPSVQTTRNDAKIRETALQLEAAFLSEMLKSSGIGKTPESFGGGAGEDHFSSFLRDAHARKSRKQAGLGWRNTLNEY
jgi:flagellar protein FlgJ